MSEQNDVDENYIARLATEFKDQKKFLATLEARVEKMKKELSGYVEEFGTPDDSGHLWLTVAGVELKRERRVSKSFDTNSAENWAKENDLWDEVKEVVERLSEDKLVALAWKNKEIAPTVQSFYVEKETWAFKA